MAALLLVQILVSHNLSAIARPAVMSVNRPCQEHEKETERHESESVSFMKGLGRCLRRSSFLIYHTCRHT